MKRQGAEKLKILFTVVSHGKANLFVDLLEENGVNAQYVTSGEGLRAKELQKVLEDTRKDVLISFVSEDKCKQIVRALEDKFAKVRNCYGVCWTVPLSAVIGVSTYRFLVDYRSSEVL